MRLVLLLAAAGILLSSARAARPGLRLADGKPVVAVYYFGHWWEPWKSDDDAIRRDFARLRAMGVTVILCDHEWSQAIDGDWRWLDREHRLAREAGLVIVPWLSAKTFSDVSPGDRQALAKKWYGVDLVYGCDQSGKPTCPLPYDPATTEFAVKWTKAYIDRYRDSGALARVKLGDREGIWVAPTVEIGWPGPGSFDGVTCFMFDRWLRAKYSMIARLNQAWGTGFASWWDIDQRDTDILDYKSPVGHEKHPVAVADRTDFCSQVLGDSLAKMSAAIRRAVPDVIIGSEIPYQLGSQNPDAISYVREYCCEPVAADHAEILVVRSTGSLTPQEIKLQDEYRQEGCAVVLTFRTYGNTYASDKPEDDMDRATFARTIADQARNHADGIGFYSWNELVDTHVAAGAGGREEVRMSDEQSARAVDLLKQVFADYLK
jgi:hypothetical protein